MRIVRYPSLKALAIVLIASGLVSCASSTLSEGGWSIDLSGGCIPGSTAVSDPVIVDGRLFVGSREGSLHAIDAATGSELWRVQTGQGPSSGTPIVVSESRDATSLLDVYLDASEKAPIGRSYISATPLVHDNTVYVGSWDYSLYALDAESGQAKWSFDAGVPIFEAAQVAGEVLVFVTGGLHQSGDKVDGLVYGLSPETGEVLWTFDSLPDASKRWRSHLPVIRNTVAYVVNWDATDYAAGKADTTYVHAIDTGSGDVRMSMTLSGAWPSPPRVDNWQILLVTDTRGSKNTSVLHAVDAATGEVLWHLDVVGGTDYWRSMLNRNQFQPPAANAERAFIATDLEVVAVERHSGELSWRFSVDKELITDIEAGPFVYVTTGKTLYALDATTGDVRWSRRLARLQDTARIHRVDGDVLYAAPHHFKLTAIDAWTGQELASYADPGLTGLSVVAGNHGICSGPVVVGDRVYLTTHLYQEMGKPPIKGHLFSVGAPRASH